MRDAARAAWTRHGGIPADERALRELPGVGPYLAAAVASIAFGRPAAAVDANVRRVLSRLFARDLPTSRARALAGRLLDRRRPGDWNQALMDLGATVCRPRHPRCAECPLAGRCRSHRRGTTALHPARRVRPAPRPVWRPTLLWTAGGDVLVERRPAGGLLGGLWGFPGVEADDVPPRGDASASDAVASLARRHGLTPSALVPLAALEYRHGFSHQVWRVTPYVPVPAAAASEGSRRRPSPKDTEWVDIATLSALPMPRAFEPLRAAVQRGLPGVSGGQP